MADMINILIVDDHPVVRDGLAAMLSTQADFAIIGEAGSGPEALDLIAARQPDILLLDLELPGMDGVEVLRRLRAARSEVKALVFTVFDTDERILSAIKAGARGYLLKGAPREELFRAVRVIHAGGSLLQPVVASRLLDHVSGANTDTASLTPREQEVLQYLARGKTNRDIAATLVITERTVKFHVSSILRKLNATNRTEAVRRATQHGLIPPLS